MAQDLITYSRKLEQILPPESARKKLRESLTVQDKLQCWFCGLPKDAKHYLGDSIICKQCVPDLVRKVDATNLILSGSSNFDRELSKLRQTSQPEFINEADRMLKALDSKNLSLGEETVRLFEEATGNNLSEDEQAQFTPDIKTAGRIAQLMWNAVKQRDEQLTGNNPYADMSDEDLMGAAIETVLEEMVRDAEYRTRMVAVMIMRVPGFLDLVVEHAEEDLPTPMGSLT